MGALSSRQMVVVAPDASLRGKALLAINIHDKAEMGLILECSSLGDLNEVRVAQMRQEAVWENREWVAEEAELSETRPVVRTPGSLSECEPSMGNMPDTVAVSPQGLDAAV